MMSLKSFIEQRDLPSVSIMGRVVAIILDCIGVNCVPCCASDAATFRLEIRGLRARIETIGNDDAALALAGDAVRAIQKYGAAAEACLSGQKQQMRKTVELLTDSLARLSDAGRESAAN